MIIRQTKETETEQEIRDILSSHFNIFYEVWGIHSVTFKKKRIDAILIPKDHLIDFPKIPIGLELKPKQLLDGNKKQAIELSKQTIDYRYTRFKMKTGYHFLPLLLIYPPYSNYLSHQQKDFEDGFSYFANRLLGKYFIGELVLDDPDYVFKIVLCAQNYYRYKNGLGKRLNMNWGFEEYEKLKAEIIEKAYDFKEYENEIRNISGLLGI